MFNFVEEMYPNQAQPQIHALANGNVLNPQVVPISLGKFIPVPIGDHAPFMTTKLRAR